MNNISNLVHSFENIINFTDNATCSKFNKDINDCPNLKIKKLATAIQKCSPIKIEDNLSSHSVTIGTEKIEFDEETIEFLKGIIEKVQWNFKSFDKKYDAAIFRAHSTSDKRVLSAISEDLKQFKDEIKSNKNLSLASKKHMAAKLDEALSHIELMKKAIDIAAVIRKGRSMQGYPGEVLSYEGYQVLQHIKEKHPIGTKKEMSQAEKELMNIPHLEKTQKAIHSLNRKTKAAESKLMGLDAKKIGELDQAIKNGTATAEQVALVVNFKKEWMVLMTEEGSYLEILSFKEQKGFEGLKKIHEIAFIHGPQVDEAINRAIFLEHIKGLPVNGTAPMKLLIEGAGPNGLYAAIQFFRSGVNVTVVNDRGERVIRNQIISLDPKWVAQLNYLLGSKFEQLFIGPEALGNLDAEWGSADINTKNLEDLMKTRVMEISSYIESSSIGQEREGFLDLHFEAPLKGIRASPNGNFSAIIEPPQKTSADDLRFQQATIDSYIKNILESPEYINLDLDDELLNEVVQIAKDQWKRDQMQFRKESPVIEFDFLACMGGANDVFRDEFLSPAVPFTNPKNYGIASWIKKGAQKEVSYLNQINFDRLGIKRDNYHNPYVTKPQVEASLRNQHFDEFIASSNFPSAFKEKYKNFTEDLLKNIANNQLQDMDPDKVVCGINLRMYENNTTVYIGAASPPLLSEFLHELESLAASSQDPKDKENLRNLKRECDKKWMNALAGVFGVDPAVVPMDPSPINVGTFDVQQKGVDVASKLLQTEKSTAIITALGDARMSPHFFSGSGTSSGRLGIQNGIDAIKLFNAGKIKTKDELVVKLSVKLEIAKSKALQKGSRFVGQNSQTERLQAKCDILKKKINEHFIRKNNVEMKNIGDWKIEKNVDKEGMFELAHIDKAGNRQLLKININPRDGQLHMDKRKFPVFNDLLVALGLE